MHFPDEQRARVEAAAGNAELGLSGGAPWFPRRTAAAGRVVCDDAGVGSAAGDEPDLDRAAAGHSNADGTVQEYAAVKLAVGFPP